MLNGKNARILALLLALVLAVGGVIGGTVAWLIAAPAPVVNTFTYGDINITLEETDTELDGDGDATTNQYKMLPGMELTKDPTVTVVAGSEEMYLFVKLDKSDNFDDFMTYDMAEGWNVLDAGVYYRWITAATVAEENVQFPVLKDNKVIVREEVTKEMLNELDADGASDYPTLTVTAYAIQAAGSDTATVAWAKIPENP